MANKKYKPKKEIEIEAEQFNTYDYLIGKTYSTKGLVALNVRYEGLIFKESPGYEGTFYFRDTKQTVQDSDWVVLKENQLILMTTQQLNSDYEVK